ncbi:MAG: hypothetical protein ACK56I_32525, partial [bacterium]
VDATRERRVCRVEPGAVVVLAALVHGDRRAVRAHLRLADSVELVPRHADGMQRLRERAPDAHDHAAEIHADKLDGMARRHRCSALRAARARRVLQRLLLCAALLEERAQQLDAAGREHAA